MGSVPGKGGSIPKRSDQRRRRNKPDGPALVKAPAGDETPAPDPDPQWHPIARDWFESLGRSGQCRFYEASDWAAARYVAHVMSRGLEVSRLSAQLFGAVMSAMSELLTTEASRRRARIELERGSQGAGGDRDAPVAQLDEYRELYG